MRLIKMLGLAAIAALASMALVGASSAMATGSTALCKVNEEPCAAANLVTELHGVTTEEPTLLTTGLPDVKCLSSLSKANVLALGNPQIAHIEALIWTHCYATAIGNPLCTVENKLLGLASILRTAANLATVTISNTSVLVDCTNIGVSILCTYKIAAGKTLHGLGAEGSSNGHLTASDVGVVRDTAHDPATVLCPEATWDALYANLTPVYIST